MVIISKSIKAINYNKLQIVTINYFSLLFILLSLFITAVPLHAQQTNDQFNAVLTSAESFFKSLKEKNYAKTWTLLSQKSQGTIVDDVFKEILKNQASQKTAVEYSKEQISADFKSVGPLSRSYWDSFIVYFDPDSVLEQSKWDIGTIKKDKAEISIQYKKSDTPAMLQMFKENNVWKVGLVETFWTRK